MTDGIELYYITIPFCLIMSKSLSTVICHTRSTWLESQQANKQEDELQSKQLLYQDHHLDEVVVGNLLFNYSFCIGTF